MNIQFDLFPAKSHSDMKDFVTENSGRGINEQSESDKSAPAAHSVDSCCRSWLHRLKPTEPVEYKNETKNCPDP